MGRKGKGFLLAGIIGIIGYLLPIDFKNLWGILIPISFLIIGAGQYFRIISNIPIKFVWLLAVASAVVIVLTSGVSEQFARIIDSIDPKQSILTIQKIFIVALVKSVFTNISFLFEYFAITIATCAGLMEANSEDEKESVINIIETKFKSYKIQHVLYAILFIGLSGWAITGCIGLYRSKEYIILAFFIAITLPAVSFTISHIHDFIDFSLKSKNKSIQG